MWKDPSGLAPEKEQDRLMGQYTYDIEVAAELYHGQLVENNYNYMLRWADAVDSFFDLMIDWKNSPEAQGGGGGRTGEDGDGENGSECNTTNGSDGNKANSTGQPNEPSPWVYNGKDYGTLDALLKATNGPKYYDIPSDDIPVYSKEKVVCEVDSYGSSYNAALQNINFLMDLSSTIFEENLSTISIGDNGKIYYKSITQGSRPFYGNRHTKVIMGKTIGRNLGTATYILTLGNEINAVSNNENSLNRFFLNLTAYTAAYRIGGFPGFIFGVVYEGMLYEFHDSRHQYFTYPTGNNNHIPSDNTKVRKIIK